MTQLTKWHTPQSPLPCEKTWEQCLLTHGLARCTGSPEFVAMEVIWRHSTQFYFYSNLSGRPGTSSVSLFVGAAIHSLHRGSAKRRERQFGIRALQVCDRVHVYLLQNNDSKVDSTKNHVLASYSNIVKQAYNTCSVRTHVSALDHVWLYLANSTQQHSLPTIPPFP